MVNPSSYRNTFGVEYVPRKELGSKSESPSFKKVGKEEVSFDLVLDGTGVITKPPKTWAKRWPCSSRNSKRWYTNTKARYTTNFVEISWGNMGFRGRPYEHEHRLQDVQPGRTICWRANVSLSFSKYARISGTGPGRRQRPVAGHDPHHHDKIRDSLPQLCQKIYGKSSTTCGGPH